MTFVESIVERAVKRYQDMKREDSHLIVHNGRFFKDIPKHEDCRKRIPLILAKPEEKERGGG